MIEIIAGLLVLGGAGFTLVAAIGILRLPDLLTRMHASTKAGTLGAMLVLAALALHFAATPTTTKTIAAVLFLMLTAPIAAHMIGRAYLKTEREKIEARERQQGGAAK
ncbi:monovalent cation/H(+) antiporter subunit G [Alkalilacustris brevis]|uniref:monovalent cation/H(+) antiporter subunit G n=1 Tax=Alkalilacustris brevis TaxID=2026338 RepID=UPI000E0CC829|nr:monovalent cation/H(+) antiporter subunit G [Alkalilacustris brevis]